MRPCLNVLLIALGWALVGCSTSRMMDVEKVMGPGEHVRGTVQGSDVIVGEGSSLEVAYSFQNRFFVTEGGSLTGFQRGGRNTKIYAEKGARLPESRYLGNARVIIVKDAKKAYQDRLNPLPPLKSRVGIYDSPGSSYDHDDDCDDNYHRADRPVSVTPESYQRKD